MLVIIYLLVDEQELSLEMLIHPKHIYNFCFLHACFVWICHVLDELSYTFDHICTNLLTQCQFLFSVVFVFQVFPLLKVPNKFRENIYKKIRVREASGITKEGPLGGH